MLQRADISGGLKNFVSKVIPLLIVFLIWELIPASGVLSESILPGFFKVAERLVEMILTGELVLNLLITLFRIAGGLFLAICIGILLGFAMATKESVKNFFDPMVTLTYPLPKPALVPLTMVWLGVTNKAAVFVIFLGAILPIIINTYHGVRSVDSRLIWAAKSLGTSEKKIFWKVVLPASTPYIANGIRIALPVAFIVSISVEFVASRAGMGNLISYYSDFGFYDYMFAVILVFVLVAFVIDRITVTLMDRYLRWYDGK